MSKTLCEEYNPIIYLDEGFELYDLIKLKAIKRKGRFSYVEYKNKEFTEHIYDTRIRKGEVEVREIIRTHEDGTVEFKDCYYLAYGMCAGLHTIWENKRTMYYGDVELSKSWNKLNDFPKAFTREHTWAVCLQEPIEIIAQDIDRLKYAAYDGSVDFMEYFILYKKYPIAEMVMKLGLHQFLKEKALKWLTEEKPFRKYIYEHKEEFGHLSAQWIHNAYKRQVNCMDYAQSLNYRIQVSKDLKSNLRDQYEFLKKYVSQEKLTKWLKENKIDQVLYGDYVKAARWLELDFNDTKVLFPRNFKEVHDDYIKQYNDAEEERIGRACEEVSKKMAQTALKFEYANKSIGGYVFIVAQNKLDLIKEGKQQNHCVGKMHYDERQAAGESLIVFMRRIEDREVPVVTIELSLRDFKVYQQYAKNNTKPTEEQIEIIAKWAKYVKSKAVA